MARRGHNNQNQHTMTPERAAAFAELRDKTIRIEGELDSLIRIFIWAREALENEMMDGLGHSKKGLNEAFTKKLKELTQGMNSVVECKIRYDRSRKDMAKNMTPEEERASVIAYIESLKKEDRDLLAEALIRRGIWKSRLEAA